MAGIIQDALPSVQASRMKQNMYVLAILSVIFLSLSLITGLFGVNLAGIHGPEAPWVFGFVAGILVLCNAGDLFLLQRLHWF